MSEKMDEQLKLAMDLNMSQNNRLDRMRSGRMQYGAVCRLRRSRKKRNSRCSVWRQPACASWRFVWRREPV